MSRTPPPRPQPLSSVVRALASADLLVEAPDADPMLAGIADDSRRVIAGDLFCTWAGTASDGHLHAPLVAEAGAAAMLVERIVPHIAVPQVRVRDGRRAAAVAASLFYGNPQDRLLLVGVTGTNGKTTTVWIVRHLLATVYRTASIGTLGVILEDGRPLPGSEALTTPGPVDLARMLQMLVARGVEAVVMEVSSHALDQGRVHALRFDAAVFTNLSRDHLDYHGTMEAYRDAKRSLVRLLRPGGWAVVNADDPAWAGVAELAPNAVTFGEAADAGVRAGNVQLGAHGARFELCTAGGSWPSAISLPGTFNVQNALAAAAACIALGREPSAVAEALATVPQARGRLECIAQTPCAVFRDYAHTPDALRRAVGALRPLTAGRIIVVFGAGGDRDRGKRPMMGQAAQEHADVVIVTSDNPRTEDPEVIVDEIIAGMTSPPDLRITDRRAAIAAALELAEPGDVILLSGKGHETYQVIGTERLPFDEKAIVAELLDGSEVGA
jgi:UDP-N-acetylmuramoyl-L-alanyl-D-glutamate--2,6-diaminopimelate ligase